MHINRIRLHVINVKAFFAHFQCTEKYWRESYVMKSLLSELLKSQNMKEKDGIEAINV